MRVSKTPINIRLSTEILTEIDRVSEESHMTRTQFIEDACRQLLEAKRFLKAQPDIQKKMLELQGMLSEVAGNQDKDFAGVFGQKSLFDE